MSLGLKAAAGRLVRALWPGRRYSGKSGPFVTTLHGDPRQMRQVAIHLAGIRRVDSVSKVMVNGHQCVCRPYGSSRTGVILAAEPEVFEPWDNAIFCYSRLPVKRVTLTPIEATHPDWPPSPSAESGDDPRALGWMFLQRARNSFKSSRFHGTFFTAYALDDHAFHLNSWIWCSAVVTKALIEEHQRRGDRHWLDWAEQTGQALTRFQRTEGEEAGGIMVRWDFWSDSPIGIVPWLAPNDSAIIGSYALLPLYQATGDVKYLNAAIKIGEWIRRRGMTEDGQLYVGYRADLGIWDKSWLYVDAGFTGTLFEGLYLITDEARWKEALKLFIDDFIQRFWCEEGCFYRTWYAAREMDRNIFARGQGWALDGLISAYRVLKQGKYLQKIVACADYLVEHQNANGSWNYMLNIEDSGECNKGTPVIAYHLLRLSELIPEATRYVSSARKALEWCEEHQYRGPDQFAVGGIHARNVEGCIVAFPNTDTIFTYGVAYYLLALNKLDEIEG